MSLTSKFYSFVIAIVLLPGLIQASFELQRRASQDSVGQNDYSSSEDEEGEEIQNVQQQPLHLGGLEELAINWENQEKSFRSRILLYSCIALVTGAGGVSINTDTEWERLIKFACYNGLAMISFFAWLESKWQKEQRQNFKQRINNHYRVDEILRRQNDLNLGEGVRNMLRAVQR